MVDAFDAVRGDLCGIVGRQHVLTDPSVRRSYEVDWTGRFAGAAPAVIRPGTTDEVAAVLATCDAAGIAVVPQGGNTGLVGGSVPLEGEVVLSLRRLSAIEPVSLPTMTVTADAGATLAAVQREAEVAHLRYAVDLAARESATIGGTVATDAGGTTVLRYGSTRHQLLGMEAVLADGTVISHLNGLVKDNTGYDLGALLCGSEGTLGVVTRVVLRLVPPPVATCTALVGFDSLAAAVRAAQVWHASYAAIEALELVTGAGMALVCARQRLASPLADDAGAYLLAEAADDDPAARLAELVAHSDGVTGAAVGVDPTRRAALWAYRDGQTTALQQLGVPHKLDVTLPAGALVDFLEEIGPLVTATAPEATAWCFGHIGDGNIHVNVTGLAPDDRERGDAVDGAVLGAVAERGGSISAEHGIGALKRRWLHLARSEAEVATFRRIKRALDPHGTMNPNVLLPPE